MHTYSSSHSPESTPAEGTFTGAGAPLGARLAVLIYGTMSYAIFIGTFLYAVGFVGNLLVPRAIDGEPVMAFGPALLINMLLLGIFAVQHSVMARPSFKKIWTKIVPKPAERSTYVLFSSIALIAVFWFWQPMGGVVWNIENRLGAAMMYAGFAFGWGLVLVSTFLINHFDLFGLRHVWLYFRGRAYTHLRFRTPGPYKLVRHPLYLGWLLAFWCTPTMTAAHLVFAALTTAYILVAIQLEERNLVQYHGEAYARYRKRVPMIVPIPGRGITKEEAADLAAAEPAAA